MILSHHFASAIRLSLKNKMKKSLPPIGCFYCEPSDFQLRNLPPLSSNEEARLGSVISYEMEKLQSKRRYDRAVHYTKLPLGILRYEEILILCCMLLHSLGEQP